MRMTRSEFLRLSARLAAAGAAASLLGPVGRALAQTPPAYPAAAKPVLRRAIPSSGEMLPVIGTGTAVIYESESSNIPQLADSLKALIGGGGAVVDTSPTYGIAERNLGEVLRRTGLRKDIFLATKISTSGEQNGIRQWKAR
jgi:hypothetical protein